MVAITEVTLRNFRGFKLDKLQLAPLTFLVGPNNSGKSSIADALLFMAQSGFLGLEATNPIWAGPLVDLGSFKDTVFRHEITLAIEIRVQLRVVPPSLVGRRRVSSAPMDVEVAAQVRTATKAPEGRLMRLSVRESGAKAGADLVRRSGGHDSFRAQSGDRRKSYDTPQPWNIPATALSEVLAPGVRIRTMPPLATLLWTRTLGRIAASVQRVSSGRHPPQRSYPRNTGSVGEQERRLLDGIDAAAIEAGHQPDQKRLRETLVRGLLAMGIASELDAIRLSDYHTAVMLRDNLTGVASNLADFGYGASQVLPVLEGCAAPGPGPLFVEQPEIHLHPRAQGELAQILCDASRQRQMIVETHSEHMINRARWLVASGKIRAKDVIIQYIDRDEEGSHAVAIGLDDAGDFTRDWPHGFFDERYRETMKLAEAQAAGRINGEAARAVVRGARPSVLSLARRAAK